MIGVMNTLTDLGLFLVLTGFLAWPPTLSNVVSFSVGTCQSYIMNSWFTFSMPNQQGHLRSFPLFGIINGVSLIFSTVIVYLGSQIMPAAAAKVGAILLLFFAGFFAHKYVTFSLK